MVIYRHKWYDPRKYIPEAIGVLAGIGYLLYWQMRKKIDYIPSDWYLGAVTVGLLVDPIIGSFSQISLKDHLFALRVGMHRGDPEGLIRKYKEYLKGDKTQARMNVELGLLLGREGRHDEALDHFKKALNAKGFYHFVFGFAPLDYFTRQQEYIIKCQEFAKEIGETYESPTPFLTELCRAMLPTYHIRCQSLRKKAPAPVSYIAYAIWHILHYKGKEAEKVWNKLFEGIPLTNTQKLEIGVLRAMCADILKENADTAWNEVIENIVEQKTFTELGESRNEVLVYKGSEFLSHTLVFKRKKRATQLNSSQSEFDEEIVNMEYYHQGNNVKTPEYRLLKDRDGYDYLVLRYAGKTIDQLVEEGASVEEPMRKAVQSLASIHYKPRECVPGSKTDYAQRAIQSLEKIVTEFRLTAITNEEKTKFLKAYGMTVKVLEHIPEELQCWYKDANPRNWAVDEEGDLTALDFEGSRTAPVHLDLISLLEFGGGQVGSEVKDQRVGEYLKDAEKLIRKKINRKRFNGQLLAVKTQRQLELSGYRTRDSHGNKRDRNYRIGIQNLQLFLDAASRLYLKPSTKEDVTDLPTRILRELQAA